MRPQPDGERRYHTEVERTMPALSGSLMPIDSAWFRHSDENLRAAALLGYVDAVDVSITSTAPLHDGGGHVLDVHAAGDVDTILAQYSGRVWCWLGPAFRGRAGPVWGDFLGTVFGALSDRRVNAEQLLGVLGLTGAVFLWLGFSSLKWGWHPGWYLFFSGDECGDLWADVCVDHEGQAGEPIECREKLSTLFHVRDAGVDVRRGLGEFTGF